MTLTIGSLFSGIGGLELGLERSGIGHVVWQCEIDPFCRAVLAKHWPTVRRFVDVTQPRRWPLVDLVCGGFPCQDVSSAGKRRGLGGRRSGLWHHFASVVRQVRPRFVVVENVASGAKAWLPTIRRDLRRLGYRTRALGIAASDVGAPHLRRRVFVVAYSERGLLRDESGGGRGAKRKGTSVVGDDGKARTPADAYGEGEPALAFDAEVAGAPESAPDSRGPRREGARTDSHEVRGGPAASAWRTPQPDFLRVADGISRGMDSPRRRIKALGNAVVPQCAEVVGLVIQAMLAPSGRPSGRRSGISSPGQSGARR